MFGQILGMRLIVSRHAYKTKTVVRGIADKRRPNNKKPFYRRVVIHIPIMYKMGDVIICAPELLAKIREALNGKT